jgi:hypothetical protein
MKYEYKCTSPMLPEGATSPIMDHQQMENWLNDMGERGWEFVGYAQKYWLGNELPIQSWWIFKREKT